MTSHPRSHPRAVLLAAACTALASGAGCREFIEDHCPACTIVAERAPDLPRLRADTPALVVLVHGAFGFGAEWDEVVAALSKDKIDFFAWSWPGPWKRAPLSVERFTAVLQQALDTLPAGVPEVVVIAHSAGGALVENAARLVRVPAGRSLRVVAIAPATNNLSAARDTRFSDDALGRTVVTAQRPLGPVPPRVSVEEHLTADAPAGGADAGPAGPAGKVDPGFRRIYLGAKVGHNESVPLVALPLVAALAARR